VKCLLRVVAAAVPGIAFLSGGQSGQLASARLNAMNVRFKAPRARLPWALAFSFARAIQRPALEIWGGEEAHRLAAQQALYHRAQCNRAARRGEYSAAMERLTRNQACCKCGIRRIAKADSLIKPGAISRCAGAQTSDRHPNRLLQLYFIRHGETAWSLTGQHTESRTFR